MIKPLITLTLFTISMLAASGQALAAGAIKIGVNPGPTGDTVEIAAAEARKNGLEVEVIEITDWTTPNVALQSKDLDLNFFQHQAFLDNAIAQAHYDFAIAGQGFLPSIGLFSTRLQSLNELKEGATIALANDTINQARGLLLAEREGLIKLREGAGSKASLNDIVENPKKIKFIEVEGPQLIRALDDVDVAQGYPARYVTAGRPEIARSGLAYTTIDDTYYTLLFVARKDNVDDPRVKQFVQTYQNSDAVAAKLAELYLNDPKLYSLPYKKQ